MRGSSPLTRGKQTGTPVVRFADGLIPAHAGKTVAYRVWVPSAAAHPRSRGENDEYAPPPLTLDGSSPLTRGKPARVIWSVMCVRLIPAHAGKTSRSPCARTSPTAHPRSRGENAFGDRLSLGRPGSSPLTRGKRFVRLPNEGKIGLIPAHAGKTPSGTSCACARAAHPRSRGENPNSGPAVTSCPGSSPLTRGKRGRCRTAWP